MTRDRDRSLRGRVEVPDLQQLERIDLEKHFLVGADPENVASGLAKAANVDSVRVGGTSAPILLLFVAMFRQRPCQQRPVGSLGEGCHPEENPGAYPFPLFVAPVVDFPVWSSPLPASSSLPRPWLATSFS